MLVGVGGAALVALLDLAVCAPRTSGLQLAVPAAAPPAWTGITSAIYGGIDEEILLRLGLMTFFVWLGSRLNKTTPPASSVLWAANILAALLFGLPHLPATAAIAPLTPVVIARAVVLNGLEGVAFGWLYWRKGLESAVVAHFSSDLVLHTVLPLVASDL